MDEEEELIDTGEEAGDSSLDDLLGGEADANPSDDQEDSDERPAESAKEEKKERDFEKAFFKSEQRRKAAEQKLKELQVKEEKPSDTLDSEGEALLKNIVLKALDERDEQGSAVREIQSKPYFNVLESEILKIADKLPSNLSTRDRLELAYKTAAADNIDLIIQTALKVGREDGFKNRSFKASQGNLRETPRHSAGTDDVIDRYNRGQLSAEELAEHADDIEAWETRARGVSKVYI